MKNFMKKKSISTIFATLVCTAWMHAAASPIPFYDYGNKLLKESKGNFVTLYFHDLNSEFAIQQNVNEKGLVNIQGNFYKPITSSHVKLTVKYKDLRITGYLYGANLLLVKANIMKILQLRLNFRLPPRQYRTLKWN